jgi:hypothetical protein
VDSDDVLKYELESARAECERLRAENAKLRLRVGVYDGNLASKPPVLAPQINKATQASASVRTDSPAEIKVSFFMNLFRGRDDVYALRWEGKTVGFVDLAAVW